MVYSNSPPSSPSVESGCSLPDDEEYDLLRTRGIPQKCCCGSFPRVELSSSSAYPGRNAIVCENAGERGHFHTFKWFDVAIMEDIRKIKFNAFPDMKAELKDIKSDLNAIADAGTNDYITASIDIAKLEAMQHENDEKIAKLERLLSKKGKVISAVELRNMLASMVVLALLCMYMHL